MRIVHSTRKERTAFMVEFKTRGFPLNGSYKHRLVRVGGRRTRRDRQAVLSALSPYGCRSRKYAVPS
jgi:hypothetical protein